MNNKNNTAILETLEHIENKFRSTIKEMNERFEKVEERMYLMQREISYLADKVNDQ